MQLSLSPSPLAPAERFHLYEKQILDQVIIPDVLVTSLTGVSPLLGRKSIEHLKCCELEIFVVFKKDLRECILAYQNAPTENHEKIYTKILQINKYNSNKYYQAEFAKLREEADKVIKIVAHLFFAEKIKESIAVPYLLQADTLNEIEQQRTLIEAKANTSNISINCLAIIGGAELSVLHDEYEKKIHQIANIAYTYLQGKVTPLSDLGPKIQSIKAICLANPDSKEATLFTTTLKAWGVEFNPS